MAANLKEKVARYELLFSRALETTGIVDGLGPDIESKAMDFLNMARSYFDDGIHFKEDGDMVNALVCFCYGHAWLDAGQRFGIFEGEQPP
jgi:hypothetical protein